MSHETVESSARPVLDDVSRITHSELCDSVERVVQTGRLGTPVSVRLHWEFRESTGQMNTILAAAVSIADCVLDLETPVWRIRRHASGRTLNVIGTDQRGRSLMITLVAQATPQTALTVFGNHGIVRLDDGWVDPATILESVAERSWFAGLQTALCGTSAGTSADV